jgi:pimeloyl-ACP methyl ester carboxylesterase
VRGSESDFAAEPVPDLGAGGYIEVTVPESGHMLHHDQPALLADCLEEFLAQD